MRETIRICGVAAVLLLSAPAPAEDRKPDCVASLERDIAACDWAIADEKEPKEKARLFYGRAWANNHSGRPQPALADLDRALDLHPAYYEALQERAYTLAELGRFEQALLDVRRALKLRPGDRATLAERAFIRRRIGDFKGAFEDVDQLAAMAPKDAGALLNRAEAGLWIQRYDGSLADVDRALALAKNPPDEKTVERAKEMAEAIRLWRTRSNSKSPAQVCGDAMTSGTVDRPNLIGDCTAALFAARNPADKGHYLTVRSLAWAVGRQNEERWQLDAEAAVAVDPANPDWRVNLGGVYNRLELYSAALREFDRALAVKESYPGLAGRAAARKDLGDSAGAFADAKRSFEIRPNAVALIVLGDLSKDRGDTASAKLHWMGAYRLGSRDDGTIARLKSVGVDQPDKEPVAK